MWRVAKAEISYVSGSILAWTVVVLVASQWPLFGSNSGSDFGSALPSAMAFLALMLPVMAVVSTLGQLSSEKNEGRVRLLTALPLTSLQIGIARQLRVSGQPLLALAVGLSLLVAGIFVSGTAVLAPFEGAWILLTLLLLSLCASVLTVLLYDLGGMAFAQIATVGLTIVAYVLNAYSPAFVSDVMEPLSAAAQTAHGALLTVLLLALLTAADLIVFGWRQRWRAS